MRLKISILIINILFFSGVVNALPSEKEFFKDINDLTANGNIEQLKKTADLFLKNFPKSIFVADIRMILAENENDPAYALQQYRTIFGKYRNFEKRDLVQYRICEILYLQSKWKDLQTESLTGVNTFKTGNYLTKYKIFYVKSLLHQEQFEKAKEMCLNITETDHSADVLSDALLLLSYINRNIYGMTKSYLYSLGELITGFNDSSNKPAVIFLLGRYYESVNEYNKAYSAYADLLAGFPKSPEAEFSKRQIDSLKKYNPVKTGYLPDAVTGNSDMIDISPEIDLGQDEVNDNDLQYSVSLGPFYNIKDAEDIKKIIGKDFQPVEITQLKNGFKIYTGRYNDIRSAVNLKIRLAEEFGINGSLVKRIRNSNNTFIYDE